MYLLVNCVSIGLSYLFESGSADNTLRIWNVCTGRCLSVIKFNHAVKDIAWNPNNALPCIAAAVYVNHVSMALFLMFHLQ